MMRAVTKLTPEGRTIKERSAMIDKAIKEGNRMYKSQGPTRLVISKLPSNEEVATMGATELANKVLDLNNKDAIIEGDAAIRVNEFLAHAAIRLAKGVILANTLIGVS